MDDFQDDDARWKAVVCKDATADGAFVYSVVTTKIFCRPVCRARLPRRANVKFYDTPTQARKAGFRACKRCQPLLEMQMPSGEAERKIQLFISSTDFFDETELSPTLESMAKHAGLSKWHFHRVFKKTVGVTPIEYRKICQNLASAGSLDDIQSCSMVSDSPLAEVQTVSSSSNSSVATPSCSTDCAILPAQSTFMASIADHAEKFASPAIAEQWLGLSPDDLWLLQNESDVDLANAFSVPHEKCFAYDDWVLDLPPGESGT